MGYDVGDEEIMRHSQQGLSLLGILISIILILLLVYGVVSLNNKNSNTISTLNYEMQQQNLLISKAMLKKQHFKVLSRHWREPKLWFMQKLPLLVFKKLQVMP